MKLAAANAKDRSRSNQRIFIHYFKIGSRFKGCKHCGETKIIFSSTGREITVFLTGLDVYRAYKPAFVGHTYYCYECGATDLQCWADAQDIGMEPIRGAADAVAAGKKNRRIMFAGGSGG